MSNILFVIIVFPLVSSFALFFSSFFLRELSFIFSIAIFYISLFLWIFFDNSLSQFQFLFSFGFFNVINMKISFGIDGFSLFFILLTTFLISLCFLFSWYNKYGVYYYASFFLLEFFLIISFSTLDLFIFYIFFESVLLPIFFIIGSFGTRDRKVRAGFLLFLYTLLGSLFMLISIVFIFLEAGTTDFLLLLDSPFSFDKQKIIFLAFFFAFSVKVPLIPFHLWLPEAHVEAPTSGSVLLAGVLLKLGTYGFLRFSIPLFPLASVFFRPFIFVISIFGIIFASLIAFRQSDIKRVIAYASIAHISLTVAGIFSFSFVGFESSLFQIVSHGVISGSLFFCVGVLYSRFHTRFIKYFSGLVQTIPLFIFYFFFFTLSNIGFPGTSGFIGEFLILVSLFFENYFVGVFCSVSLVLGSVYSLWLFNRVSYGNLKVQYISFSRDLTFVEFYTFLPLFFVIICLGLFPSLCFNSLDVSCSFLSKLFLYGVSNLYNN
jgi:proton-translocating NADH-quinone oxidoreductase chain M